MRAVVGMKLLKTWRPSKGQFGYNFVKFFVDKINFCEGVYYDSNIAKPENKIYNFFYKYWLFPFEQNDCICCNTVRGIIYGAIIAYLL